MYTKIDKLIGTMVIILAIIILESVEIPYKIATIMAIFVALIMFSIYKGGVFSGISSVIIAISYTLHLKESRGLKASFFSLSNHEFVLDILCIMAIGIIAAVMDYKYRSCYEKYKEADAYLSRAKEISEIMICHSTIDGKIIKVHSKLCSILKYTQDELLEMSTWDLIYPEDISKEQKLTDDIIKGDIDTFNIEKRLYKKSGEIVWIFSNISAVKDNNGEIIYLLRYLVDITEDKIMRDQLKNQVDFLHKLMDAIPNPIFIKNIKNKEVNVNKALSDYAGRDCNNSSYRDILTLVPEDEARRIIQSCNSAVSCNETQEHSLILPDSNGQKRHALISIAPYTDINGQTAGIIGSITDITNIMKIKEELRRSEEKYRSLVELDPDAVIIHKGDTITFMNDAGKKMFGVSENEEIIGRSLYEFIHPDYRDSMQTQIGRACINLNCPGVTFEAKIISQYGMEIEVEVINVGFTNGNGIRIMAIIRDITERKKAEELKKTVKENERRLAEAKEYETIKNEFFANISHELRTPLNVILGTLQLLSMPKGDNKSDITNKHLSVMKHNCYRLLRLVSNLIDITKIDTGYFEICMGCHDIVNIVEDITLSVADYIKGKNLTLEFDTDIEEKIVNCDIDQMERIMLNLISNAVKFTKPGGKISVSINDKGNSVAISVKDTGIGIPKDKQKIIFERFRQVDKSLTRDREGSGIGLSLVKDLVEMQEGTISLISSPGRGSEFIIELPAYNNIVYNNEEIAAAQSLHIDRAKLEFSDIYS